MTTQGKFLSMITNVILTLLLVCGLIYHPQPLPCLECKTEGAVCLPGPPSLASNMSRRGHFKSSPTTPPPIPPPSLQTRVGGVVLSFDPPRHTYPPPSLQMQVGGGVFSLDPSCYTHSPSLTSDTSRRGRYYIICNI